MLGEYYRLFGAGALLCFSAALTTGLFGRRLRKIFAPSLVLMVHKFAAMAGGCLMILHYLAVSGF